jgi:hypothetical protein
MLWRMTAQPQPFRLYEIDRKGSISPAIEMFFDTTMDALDYAARQRTDRSIELWSSTELIARLRMRPRAA